MKELFAASAIIGILAGALTVGTCAQAREHTVEPVDSMVVMPPLSITQHYVLTPRTAAASLELLVGNEESNFAKSSSALTITQSTALVAQPPINALVAARPGTVVSYTAPTSR
jgi:hypothetical protein